MASFAHRSTRIAGVLALVAAAVFTTGVRAFGAAAVPPPEPRFEVVADPPAARPGDPVTVTLTPLDSRFNIVDCLVAFPAQDGGRCRRSPHHWFADTTVPRDAPPGPTVLRWGVTARDADGRPAADNASIEYEVLPPRTRAPVSPLPPTTAPTSTPHRSSSPAHTPSALATVSVVNAAPTVATVWGKSLQVIGWCVLGAVLLAMPFAFGGIRALIRRRWRRWRRAQPNRPEDVESGDQVEITAIADIDRSAVLVRDHDRWPVHLIWSLAPIDPRLEEYP